MSAVPDKPCSCHSKTRPDASRCCVLTTCTYAGMQTFKALQLPISARRGCIAVRTALRTAGNDTLHSLPCEGHQNCFKCMHCRDDSATYPSYMDAICHQRRAWIILNVHQHDSSGCCVCITICSPAEWHWSVHHCFTLHAMPYE